MLTPRSPFPTSDDGDLNVEGVSRNETQFEFTEGSALRNRHGNNNDNNNNPDGEHVHIGWDWPSALLCRLPPSKPPPPQASAPRASGG